MIRVSPKLKKNQFYIVTSTYDGCIFLVNTYYDYHCFES